MITETTETGPTKKRASQRVPTGIKGFDELCEGGLISGRTYLLSGIYGSGKTIFSLQYLYNGITKYDDAGIFIATEERPEQIRQNASNFGWDLDALEAENKLAIVDACATKVGLPSTEKYVDIRPFDMRSMLDQLIKIREEIGTKRAVVDSSTSIGFYLQMDPVKIRVELLRLSSIMNTLNLTSLLTCEVTDDSQTNRFGVENFVTDGSIILYFKKHNDVRARGVEIYKMRGTKHSEKVHSFSMASEGIVVHPDKTVNY